MAQTSSSPVEGEVIFQAMAETVNKTTPTPTNQTYKKN
jgi:hypothetical protein